MMNDFSPSETEELLFVCSYDGLEEHVRTLNPAFLISVLGPDDDLPWPFYPGVEHLKLSIDDVPRPLGRYRHATEAHLRLLLDFLEDWNGSERMIVHCWAGQSRSPAVALTAMVMLNPGREYEAARLLRERAPQAWPNELIVSLADVALGCGGALISAVDTMPEPDWYPDTDLISLPAHLPPQELQS